MRIATRRKRADATACCPKGEVFRHLASHLRETRRLQADEAGIAEAAALLRAGRLVAFPTETVYGLGALATDAAAVDAIYRAKGRPAENPLIVHVADKAAAARLAVLDPVAERLADAFWPGPLTLVLPRRADDGLAPGVTAGGVTVGVRVPGHPVARALLTAVGGPVAAPSANPSGRVSPTTADHVLDRETGLARRIDAVLDGGACPVGLESTIVMVAEGRVRLLRPGGIPAEALAEALGAMLEEGAALAAGAPLASPGLMESHYAPAAPLRLDAAAPRPGEAWLGFGPDPEGVDPARALNLSPAGDMVEAAANLFAALRRIDAIAGTAGTIAVARVPDRGLGRAINDRLRRAAAPRP